MPDSSLGGNHYLDQLLQIKREAIETFKGLRKDVMVDGHPPGTVPVKAPQRQSELLRGLQASGVPLGPHERRRIALQRRSA